MLTSERSGERGIPLPDLCLAFAWGRWRLRMDTTGHRETYSNQTRVVGLPR